MTTVNNRLRRARKTRAKIAKQNATRSVSYTHLDVYKRQR